MGAGGAFGQITLDPSARLHTFPEIPRRNLSGCLRVRSEGGYTLRNGVGVSRTYPAEKLSNFWVLETAEMQLMSIPSSSHLRYFRTISEDRANSGVPAEALNHAISMD